jgi:hypothetical protein
MSSHSRLDAIRDHLAPASAAPIVAIEDEAEVAPAEKAPKFPDNLRTVFPPLELEDHTIDDVRPLRVVVVGGGISGILSAILLPAKVPKIDLVVYERESDIVNYQTYNS